MPEPGILSPEPSADNNQPHEEPEVFRCLACLSFFIPSGKWVTFSVIKAFQGHANLQKKNKTSEKVITTGGNLNFFRFNDLKM